METEFEAKFYPVDKDKYRQKLLSAGAKLLVPERKMIRAIIDRRLHPQLQCDYIRVRDEGNLVRLSAKTHARQDGKVSDQKEVDVEVGDYQKTIDIFELAGLPIDKVQETLRETWELEGAEITIDTWPGLDPYSEIEAASEEEVKRLAQKLGFDWEKKIITAALEIFAEKYHLSIDAALERFNHITFENNPFSSLPAYPIANSQSLM